MTIFYDHYDHFDQILIILPAICSILIKMINNLALPPCRTACSCYTSNELRARDMTFRQKTTSLNTIFQLFAENSMVNDICHLI